jgi:protein-tyrosine phosphatase
LKQKILFVCLGNICRSPLAEAVFLHLAEKAGASEQFEADSCGTSAEHRGSPPDERSVKSAQASGIKIRHKARKLSPGDFRDFDLILTMDKHNHRETTSLARRHGYHMADIRLMRSFDPLASENDAEVPDPWYGGEEGFTEVFEILHRSCQNLLNSLQEQVKSDG